MGDQMKGVESLRVVYERVSRVPQKKMDDVEVSGSGGPLERSRTEVSSYGVDFGSVV
jgi:hypothetical protein